MGFEAGVGQVVLPRRHHHQIGGAVEGAQAEVVVQVADVVHGEAELGRRVGGELAKHHQLQILQAGFTTQMGEGSEQQIHPFARVVAATDGAKQQERAILRQTK